MPARNKDTSLYKVRVIFKLKSYLGKHKTTRISDNVQKKFIKIASGRTRVFLKIVLIGTNNISRYTII